VLHVSCASAWSGLSGPAHEKPIEGATQPPTLGSSAQVLVEANAGTQQYPISSPESAVPWLQMRVGSSSSGVSVPVHE
jgi:hypothetical protein